MEAQIERLLARQAALQEERERLARVLAVEARAPRRDWQGAFEWDDRIAQLLGTVFGLASFRPLQREVINATLQVGAGFCWILLSSRCSAAGRMQQASLRARHSFFDPISPACLPTSL